MRLPNVRPTTFACLALLLWGLPAAQAQDGGTFADVTASGAAWSGVVDAAGGLGVFALLDNPGEASLPDVPPDLAPEPRLPDPAFAIEGQLVTVHTARSDDRVHVIMDVPEGAGAPPERQTQAFGLARVLGSEVREEYSLQVRPLGGAQVHLATSCLRAGFPDANETFPSDLAQDADKILLEPCAAAELRIEGSFAVTMWQWDADLSSPDGDLRVESGYTDRRLVFEDPGGIARGAWVSDDVAVTLEVERGTLVVPAYDPPGYARIFVHGFEVHGLGSAELHDVQGEADTADGTLALEAERMVVSGDLTVASPGRLGGGARQFAASIWGRVDSARADGQSLSLATVAGPSGPDGSLLSSWGAAAVGAAVLVPAAAGTAWGVSRRRLPGPEPTPAARRRAAQCFQTAQSFEIQGRPELALQWVDRALRHDGLEADYHALRARALSMLGDYAAALRVHRHVNEMLSDADLDAKAWNAFEASKCCQMEGRADEALAWLHTALRLDPGLRDELRAEPGLQSLSGDGRLLRRPQSVRPEPRRSRDS